MPGNTLAPAPSPQIGTKKATECISCPFIVRLKWPCSQELQNGLPGLGWLNWSHHQISEQSIERVKVKVGHTHHTVLAQPPRNIIQVGELNRNSITVGFSRGQKVPQTSGRTKYITVEGSEDPGGQYCEEHVDLPPPYPHQPPIRRKCKIFCAPRSHLEEKDSADSKFEPSIGLNIYPEGIEPTWERLFWISDQVTTLIGT